MKICLDNCDFNEGYFHFTNIRNVERIIEQGLIPSIGAASKLVNDRKNVSISKGFRGVLGIINSFILVFKNLKICKIPDEFKKYFNMIENFNDENYVSPEMVNIAIKNKLKDEVYIYINSSDIDIEQARIGGLTGYDINLDSVIDNDKIKIITDNEGNIISAYDVVSFIYEKVKEIDIVREMNEDFFEMMETDTDIKKL